jgi:flagellar motor component MotA
MEIVGLILLILIIIGSANILKSVDDSWNVALMHSFIIIISTMLSTALLSVNKFHEEGVKEYLQHPERYIIKVVYEDSIPCDTIVELK